MAIRGERCAKFAHVIVSREPFIADSDRYRITAVLLKERIQIRCSHLPVNEPLSRRLCAADEWSRQRHKLSAHQLPFECQVSNTLSIEACMMTNS